MVTGNPMDMGYIERLCGKIISRRLVKESSLLSFLADVLKEYLATNCNKRCVAWLWKDVSVQTYEHYWHTTNVTEGNADQIEKQPFRESGETIVSPDVIKPKCTTSDDKGKPSRGDTKTSPKYRAPTTSKFSRSYRSPPTPSLSVESRSSRTGSPARVSKTSRRNANRMAEFRKRRARNSKAGRSEPPAADKLSVLSSRSHPDSKFSYPPPIVRKTPFTFGDLPKEVIRDVLGTPKQ
jgi:hypothetical protein